LHYVYVGTIISYKCFVFLAITLEIQQGVFSMTSETLHRKWTFPNFIHWKLWDTL